jgi:hypothetical protein
MRKFQRPIIECQSCHSKIYDWRGSPEALDPTFIESPWTNPPKPIENCPRCGTGVDTTTAYPFIKSFPPIFQQLKDAYAGFSPKWEFQRQSFESYVQKFLAQSTVADCEASLNTAEGLEWYKQRIFYRSATAFHRSLQLFLGYLTLDRHCYRSWAQVTAYYSRFYFIQAFLNLALSTFLSLPKYKIFIFFDGQRVNCVEQRKLPPMMSRFGSHDIWWSLMEALKTPDFPIANLEFILTRLVFNPEERQTINYDFEYLGGGFIELDWFDSGAKQMLNHFNCWPRADQDITDIDRFFEGKDPENVDEGNFYGDEAQIIWCSLMGYLQMLKALEINQRLVLTETIAALSELHIGEEYPDLLQGIVRSTAECLQDGFDLDKFKHHYGSGDQHNRFFTPW